MEKFYVELNGYGCCEYTEAIMFGTVTPSKVFAEFHHKKITSKDKNYIAAYGSEDIVLEKLVKHFESYGYEKLKTKSFSVGD